MTTKQLAQQVRQHAAELDGRGRAELMEELARAVYEAVKFDNPEGAGEDGRDGPERASLGRVVDEVINHRSRLALGKRN